MKLSFVILSYKNLNHLRLCITNIKKLQLPFSYEIIAVDNASEDGSREMVLELFPEVKLIVNQKNIGHPAGNNIGFRQAQGEYIAMINPDIIFRSKKDILNILEYLTQHQDVALVGPRVYNPDGSIQHSCYRKYSLLTPVFRRTFLGQLPFGKRNVSQHLMTDFAHDQTREVDWLLGACLFIRKKAIELIGLMNEKLFSYFGDYEWCDRAWKKDWKVVYYHNTSHIFHYHKRESAKEKSSIKQLFSYVTRIHIKDWLLYLKMK